MQQLDYSVLFNQPPVAQQITQMASQYQQMQAQQAVQAKAEQEAALAAQQAVRQQEFLTAFQAAAGDTRQQAALASQYPEQLETIKGVVGLQSDLQSEAMGQLSLRLASLAQTDPTAAAQLIEQNADVLSAQGPGYEPQALLARLQDDPAALAQQADTLSLIALGPEKYQEIMGDRAQRNVTMRGQDITVRGQDITSRGQDIQIMGQQQSRENALISAQSRIEAARLRQSDPSYPDLSVNMEKALDGAIQTATESESSAARLEALASEFVTSAPPGGRVGRVNEWFREQTGEEDQLSALRRQFIQLKNERVINNLPPGVASDRDIEIFMAGFPQDFANPEYVASFMRGMAKAERAKAELANFRAEWISQNGNPGQNRRPFDYNGVQIDSGVSLKNAFDGYIQANPPWQTPTQGFPALDDQSRVSGAQSNVPAVGAVVDGFVFKGGNPADQNNWERR